MLVSVIIPYNEDRGFLDRCVQSIENQTYRDFEIVYAYSKNPVAVNVNYGFSMAKGELLKVVGEDDWLPENSLKDLVEGIGDAPWAVANAYNVIGGVVEPYAPETLDFAINVQHNKIHNGGTIYRADVIKKIGGMDESLWTGEEYEMHLRMMSLGYLPKYINKYVYFYRQHRNQKYKKLNRENREKRAKEIARIQSLYIDKV